ncbi:MAG: hypothetical protein QQN60_07335, partial [Nitrosopumilus sp.]
KTFNVAKILFQTKHFFLFESTRSILDQGHKNQLLMLKNNFGINSKNEIHENERLEACDDKHRKGTLENLFLNYQFFRNDGTSEKEAEERQNILWEILDNYYRELPKESEQTESDKIWRLFLARMDKRKMNITTEKTDAGIAIQFNPEIEPDLKEYSEKSVAKVSDPMKYLPLKHWAELKIINDDNYKKYAQYENDPKLALKQVKDIVAKLKKSKTPNDKKMQHPEEESFILFNHSIPAYVCSLLIRDHLNEITNDEKTFCKDIVIETAYLSLSPNYQYQVSDGIQPSISVLPVLLEIYPEEKENIKLILLLTLFFEYHVGGILSNENFSIFSIMAIHKLWENNFSDAQSILFGYLLLKPRYDELSKRIREENYKKGIYESHDNQLIERYFKENEEGLQNVIQNKLTLNNLKDIDRLDLSIQETAFQLIPQKTDNEDHKKIVKVIIFTFAEKLYSDDRDDKIDYKVKHDFLKTYAYFVLNSHKDEIQDYLKPFLDNFNTSESIADLFQEFVLAEDMLNTYDNFWLVWNSFKEKIFEICKDGDRHWYVEKIVKSYLFAQVPWKETVKEWHTLKDNNKRFFKEVSQKIGNCPSVLYSITKLLNDIGSTYINDGIGWISNMLSNNQDLIKQKLEVNTIYYIENLVRKYIFKNREKVRKTKTLKDEVLVILDFLINKGSVVGYMLRENIV